MEQGSRGAGVGKIMPMTVEVEQQEDGRWLAEVPELPGVLTCLSITLWRF
jgi:hypothetical protein